MEEELSDKDFEVDDLKERFIKLREQHEIEVNNLKASLLASQKVSSSTPSRPIFTPPGPAPMSRQPSFSMNRNRSESIAESPLLKTNSGVPNTNNSNKPTRSLSIIRKNV